ncbi:MAG: hypothetical protein ACP5GX_09080 [Anaerolineae bacterium]
MGKKPTNMREYRKRTERNLLIAVVLVLIIAGGAAVGIFYGWEAVLSALVCLIPGAILIVALWLLLTGVDRITRD